VTVTVCPVCAGLGETPLTVTTGARSFTVTEVLAEPVDPPLSVAVRVMVKDWLKLAPVDEYVCDADVVLPDRLVVDPSPQLITIDDTVPSGSALENPTVTIWPVEAGLGETLLTLTEGTLSFTVTELEANPVDPPLSEPETVIVKLCDNELPVLA